ncbi:DUF952 domain-containing protein [Actinomadura sp. SCN-SB]|uniref:DUF952 domain-containing protein n=1 Tax=Actinomadura sp. SCN-SB TaxID=3373092 RepID=UPI0037516FBE
MTVSRAPAPQETLLHIAERRRWESARDLGVSYTMSTLGRTLDEEGFIHCSKDLAQVKGVLSRFYGGIDPADLVLLVIDTAKLDVPVRYERAPDAAGDELFPHVYGPIPLDAVIDVRSVPANR